MFEHPDMMYLLWKQKHEELMAELEMIRKSGSSSIMIKKKKRRFSKIMLSIADLFIATGVGLKRRFSTLPERSSDIIEDVSEP